MQVPLVNDEGGMMDIPSQQAELTEFDESWMRETMAGMVRHLMKKLSKPWMKEMFKRSMPLGGSEGR